MSILLLLFSFALFDAEFVKMLFDDGEAVWQMLGDTTVPAEENRDTLAVLAEKLARTVPRSFLRNNVVEHFPPNRGEVVRLEGTIFLVVPHDAGYCCYMELYNGECVDIYVPNIPEAWKQDVPLQERAAAFGVFVKSYDSTLVFCAPSIEWYPNTWLGNLGFDVSTFDHVPVSRVIGIEQNDDETNRQTFKFTEADKNAFYGLLQVVSSLPEGWLEEEAKKQQEEKPIHVIDLFNHPEETRGKPILLRGTAARVVSTPVKDEEVQTLFGIDHYYQIFLYTEQSRGNPIVICVPSLPEGMPVGDGDDFAEQITAAAVSYKLWIYDTSKGQHYAPIMIGHTPTWHPKPAGQRLPPQMAAISFSVFFTLVVIWWVCRFWMKRSQ